MLVYDKILVDPDSCTATYDGQIISLHPQQYRLLVLFLKYPRQVLSYEVIIDNIWNDARIPTESTIRSHIKGLRKALKKAGETRNIIETVRTLGYRLKPLKEDKSELVTAPISAINKFLKSKAMEYLVLDENLIVQSISDGIVDYCDYPQYLKLGEQVGEAFPEFIGFEENFKEVLHQEQPSFEIQGVAKIANPNRPEYLNFYVICNRLNLSKKDNLSPNNFLFIFIEDDSENMILRRKLVQQINEYEMSGKLKRI